MVKLDEGKVSIKLIDYNISQKVKDSTFQMFSNLGTLKFMAPEMVKNQKFNEKIDLWGAGCIACFIMTGKLPENGSK
jgi:serine/threonine protein kinase